MPEGKAVGGCAPTIKLLTNMDEKTWAVLWTCREFANIAVVLSEPPILMACPTSVEVVTEFTLAIVL